MTTYTSPRTGLTYDVVTEKHSRTDYREFMNPDTAYEREYTQYNIYRDGKLVQFTFSETGVTVAIAWYECPGADVSSRYD
jgi:hypothetical protein